MAKVALLGVLWIGCIVGLTTAREVINCLDNRKCDIVRAVVQNEQDVKEVMRRHPRSKMMDLHGNLLSQFPSGGYNMPSVQWEHLNISYNLLANDVFQYNQSPKLRIVDITYNQLTGVTVPPAVVEFTAERNKLHYITITSRILQKLILPKNKFDSLRNFGNLPQLVEFDMSCNQLEKLNVNDLASMTQLKSLKMANNHIHVIEGTIPMRSLEHLDLSSNILTTVDETFNNFPNLKSLNLYDNKIVMWLENFNIGRSLQSIYVDKNDWDCSKLKIVARKYGAKFIQGNAAVTCTTADSPYADRLIKYRKAEFHALQTGAAQRQGNVSCDSFVPSPCDGDDNLVYEVAGSAVRSAEDFAKLDLQELQQSLAQEENAVRTIEGQIAAEQAINDELTRENEELASYINEQYKQVGLSGITDPIAQMNALFNYYENENTNLKQAINEEERKNSDALDNINRVQAEIDDEIFRRDRLQEELNKRNQTVMGYQKKINELKAQLEKQGTRV